MPVQCNYERARDGLPRRFAPRNDRGNRSPGADHRPQLSLRGPAGAAAIRTPCRQFYPAAQLQIRAREGIKGEGACVCGSKHLTPPLWAVFLPHLFGPAKRWGPRRDGQFFPHRHCLCEQPQAAPTGCKVVHSCGGGKPPPYGGLWVAPEKFKSVRGADTFIIHSSFFIFHFYHTPAGAFVKDANSFLR